MTKHTLGWHFCKMHNGKPFLRDGTPLKIGMTYTHEGTLSLCESGFHDSARVIDALRYAPGSYLCRTLASCDIVDGDKRCSRTRIAIAGADVTDTLRLFAVRLAYCALLSERNLGREPDPRSWEVLRVQQAWIRGEATDGEREAAYSAAYLAARSAAYLAARSASYLAAYSASDSAAYSASYSAADKMLSDMLPERLREAGV